VSHTYRPALKPAKGLIQRDTCLQHYKLTRYLPSDDMAGFVENYWIANWDLSDSEPYQQVSLPHPCQNMIISPTLTSGIFGVHTGKIIYKFEGKGRIFGVKFWPGAFHSFYTKPVSKLSDTLISIDEVFDTNVTKLEAELLVTPDFSEIAYRIEDMFRRKSPELDSKAVEVRNIIKTIEGNRDLVTVSTLVEIFGHSARTLQRLFDNYVGVSPKWVIDRYRMLEAVAALDDDANISIIELANTLGYFDQAHFTKAFTKLVGYPPSRYNFN
tara:strand:- start:3972 stop:4781 length:810 start_codon:yes stop_codon:yes gene_type:complete